MLTACGLDEVQPGGSGVLLLLPSDADPTTERMVEESTTYFRGITGEDPMVARIGTGRMDDLVRRSADRGAGLVFVFDAERLASDEVDVERLDALPEGGFVLQTETVGSNANRLGGSGSTFVLMAGASTLGRQYAGYEALRRLGVRFYHPEQEYVPRHSLTDLQALAERPTILDRGSVEYTPDFRWRSWSFHSAHPLEHLEAFSDAAHPLQEARNVNLWQVKNFGNRFRGLGRGVAPEDSRAQRRLELEDLRDELGFPRGTGITLHNQQQGANAEIDRSSPIDVRTQIESLVEQRLADAPDARWFGIHFGPTEFTTTDPHETVDWINWAGRHALSIDPEIEVEINDHITGSQPMEGFDDLGCPSQTNSEGLSDYYDLAFHTDPRLGVRVHTVMFYPLEGPARVYNQRSFEHKRCLMERASAEGRPLGWFPEGSWWLSFDNPIPVYLPLHVWTRWRDVDLVRPLLASRGGGTLKDHRMFNSGQEWGYWQQDYAVGLLAWNADVTYEEVWAELLEPMCAPAQWREGCAVRDEVTAIMTELVAHQREFFLEREDYRGRPGGLFSYFAGEDQADIIAAQSGFEFRPVRVSFDDVMTWDRAQIDHFRRTDLDALNEAALVNAGWRDRLFKAREFIAEGGLPWFEELTDGVEINEMRARQAAALYTAVLAVREAELMQEPNPAAFGEPQYEAAQMVLSQARTVIARREAAYRYPAEQTFGGGLNPDTAVSNGTTYPYRVHTKTHLLTYWTNRDAEVRAILDGDMPSESAIRMVEAIDAPGADLTISWPKEATVSGSLMVGSVAVVDPSIASVDLGDDEGYWPVAGDVVANNPYIDISGGIVRAAVRGMTPKSGLTLLEPANKFAQIALANSFPAVEWAWISDPAALFFAIDRDSNGSVDFQRVVRAEIAAVKGNHFETQPVTFTMPVEASGGEVIEVAMTEVVFSGEVPGAVIAGPVTFTGQISIDGLVATLISLAGYDEPGAIETLAGFFGFDPSNPPATMPIEASLATQARAH